ncbi:MAG: bacterial Ig-like domain-containing protein [Clostridia bacterium]|nr:bacterial Ig-like domain-containing protein [Clostridia bacterium]
MKKYLSILLAVLMIVSTVAISGIVTSSAADTNPSDDAYVYYSDASDARKSGFAYDFTDFTIDGSDLSKYTAEMWIYIGQPNAAVNPQYDFLVSLYPAGHFDATVGSNYTEKWAIRKEYKTGELNVGWNKQVVKLSDFIQGSGGNTAYNQPAHAALVADGTLTAMTVHENSTAGTAVYGSVNIGISSFTITDGTNTYNVIDPAKTKASSDIVNSHTGNTRAGAVGAAMVADLPIPVPVESYDERITLIDPAADKSVDDMLQINVNTSEDFSVVDTATLTGGTEGVPSSTAYYIDQLNAVAKSGAMIKVGGDDGIKIANLYDDFMGGEIYVNAWVWIDDPDTANIIFRMFERYDNRNSATSSADNYIETCLNNNGVGTLTAGWNYISQNITAVVKGGANGYHGQAFQGFAAENVIRYISFYSHNTSLSDIAVAAVELSTVDGESDWDVNIEGKKMVYRRGEQTAAADFIVTDKGAVVDPANYTVSAINTEKAGRQFVTITYDSKEYKYEIYYKDTLGQSVYHTTYSGESSVIAGNRNGDNAVIGASSVQHTATGTAVSYHVASTPLNLYGEEFLEMYIYFEANCITNMKADAATDVIRLLVEPTSNASGAGYNGVRILLTDTFFINQGCVAGWNKIYIPLNPGTYGNQADSPAIGGVQTNWQHDSQTSGGKMYMDYENVRNFRIRFDKFSGSVALINAVGYGMDTYINGEHGGNDLIKAVELAPEGATVKVNWKQSIADSIKVTKNITLDLNGQKITTTAGKIVELNGGDITVIDTNVRYNYSLSGANFYPANKGYFSAKSSAVVFSGTGSETAYIEGSWTQTVTDGTAKIAGNASFPFNDSYKAGIDEMTDTDIFDASVLYTGNWQTIKNVKGPVNNDAMRSTDAGDSYVFAFSGTAFALNAYTSPTYGQVEVFVDGISYGTLDLYSAEQTYQQHIFGAVVKDGYHTVQVKTLGTKNSAAQRPTLFYNAIDTVSVVGELKDLSDYNFIDMNKTLTKNTASFVIENAFIEGAELTGLTASAVNGEVTVSGNVIKYEAGAQTDVITYYMNGIKGVINITLADGVKLEAENICISKDINNNPIANDVRYAWKLSGHEAIVLDPGEYVEFTFEGTGFEVISYKSSSYKRMAVYIDGTEVGVFNLTSSTIDEDFQKSVFTSDTLEDKEHLVQIVAIGKGNVDAIVLK